MLAQVRMPSLPATAWIGSEPLGPPELRGHVVLVNFWTLTCINWLRQEPYVRAWSEAYRGDGLIVIGVHTPEFTFEHDVELVRRATAERAIGFPVAVDNDYAIWSAFANHFWPALYFVDADGIVRDQHFGEGRYEQSERVIQTLLGVERELVDVEGTGVEAAADWERLQTPETYLGAWRGAPPDSSDGLRLNQWAGPIPFRVRLDGEAPRPSAGVDVDEAGAGVLEDGRMYQLVREPGAVRDRTLEIEFSEPGAEAYAFTFG